MLNMGYALVKLFFRRNAPASATFMSHWCMIVAFVSQVAAAALH